MRKGLGACLVVAVLLGGHGVGSAQKDKKAPAKEARFRGKTVPQWVKALQGKDLLQRVRALNARDRRKDKPTNVLSYPSGERGFLGDVVLARQTVWLEARQQRKTPSAHISHLVVHGTLHLLGYDHETGDADAERMEALERRILKRLGIADPY